MILKIQTEGAENGLEQLANGNRCATIPEP